MNGVSGFPMLQFVVCPSEIFRGPGGLRIRPRRNLPSPTRSHFRSETCIVQPAPVKGYSRTVWRCRPCQAGDRVDEGSRFVVRAVHMPLHRGLSATTRILSVPERLWNPRAWLAPWSDSFTRFREFSRWFVAASTCAAHNKPLTGGIRIAFVWVSRCSSFSE